MIVHLTHKIPLTFGGLFRGHPFIIKTFSAYHNGKVGVGKTMHEAIANCIKILQT